MSFILDALKKSETERQRQSGPALFEVKVAPPRTRIAPWAIGLVLLLALNLFVLGWVAMRDRAPAAEARQRTAAAVGADAPTPATTSLPAATAPPPLAPAVAPAVAPGTDAIPSKAPPLLEEPLLEEPVLEEAVDAESRPPPAPAAAGDAVTPSNLPTRDDLVARGTPVPELRLDMHVYGPRPDERFIFVNMRRLREGDSTADGLRIERITPEGAILSWQGRRFLLPKE